MKNIQFQNLDLKPPFLKALSDIGYSIPTPIQGETIPAALKGSDILGIAQTGTGKTADSDFASSATELAEVPTHCV